VAITNNSYERGEYEQSKCVQIKRKVTSFYFYLLSLPLSLDCSQGQVRKYIFIISYIQ
jgi:hypothetical protein